MTSPQVSVVIPTHNRSALLALTLRSVLRQENVDLEAIVVDDGSTDPDVRTVPGLDDPRVRILRNETAQGVSSARNRGIDEARGAWVAFLDDDDLWAPGKLAAQLRAADERGSAWAYTGVVKIDERNSIIGGKPPPSPHELMARLPRWNLVPGGCSGVVARRAALAEAGRFDPQLVNLADWDLWIRLGRAGSPACAPDPLVAYRFHRRQASLDVGLILREADLVDGRYGAKIDRGALHHYVAYRCLVAGAPRRQALKHWAQAALHGQSMPVAADISRMALAGVNRRLSRAQGPDRYASWRAQATPWLSKLEDPVDRSLPAQPHA